MNAKTKAALETKQPLTLNDVQKAQELFHKLSCQACELRSRLREVRCIEQSTLRDLEAVQKEFAAFNPHFQQMTQLLTDPVK